MQYEKLNEEEKEITKFVIEGLTNIEIGVEMGYSCAAIKKRLTKIYKSMNVSNRFELLKKLL